VHNIHILSTAEICLATIDVNESSIEVINPSELPKDWNANPLITQQFGKLFISKGVNYCLKVPSAVVPGESNILLNPYHSAHSKTKIVEIMDPIVMDKRLFELGK
jgi:RES domain-containing protein